MTTANFYQSRTQRGRNLGPAFNIGHYIGHSIGHFIARFNRTHDDPAGPQWQISRGVDGSYELLGPDA